MIDLGEMTIYTLLFVSMYFEIFLLLSFLERGQTRGTLASSIDSGRLPTVAVVVPCFNEAKTILSTVESLFALEYPKEKLEILIIDDGSTDDTLAVARGLESHSNVRVFTKTNGGKYTALNAILEKTSAELIGCLDADSVVAKDALMHIVPVFEDTRIAAATPGIHTKKPETFFQYIQHAEYNLSVFNRFIFAALGSAFITPGAFSIYRSKVVRELGGWRHGHSGEDLEMALRMQAAGHLIANVPGAVVHTGTPRSLRELFRQRVRWTYSFLRNLTDYRFMFGNRRYGNLGLIVLPVALVSIGAGMYFFLQLLWYFFDSVYQMIVRAYMTGTWPQPYATFDLFYINTSAMSMVALIVIALILAILCAGSWIGTGSRRLPAGTPLFILFYGFIAPLWVSAAIFRAVFKTGVRWR